jgi:hypothetical protein
MAPSDHHRDGCRGVDRSGERQALGRYISGRPGWKPGGGLGQIPPFRVDLATGKASLVPPASLLRPQGFRLRSTRRRGGGKERLRELARKLRGVHLRGDESSYGEAVVRA